MALTKIIRLSGIGLVAAVILGACSPLGTLNLVLADDEGVSAVEGVVYGPESRHRLDVYTPSQSSLTKRPAVIFFYGGSWRNGDRADYRFVGQALARRGVVTIIPDYRLYPQAKFPEFMHDAAKAVRWVVENADTLQVDADRISLAGHSAGAHLAATLALDPRYLDAEGLRRFRIASVIGIAGPYAFDPLAYTWTRPVFQDTGDIDNARPAVLAAGYDRDSGAHELPTFTLLHGADDTTVFPKNSKILAKALRAAKVRVRYSVYPDIGHYKILLAFYPAFRSTVPVLEDVVDAVNATEELRGRADSVFAGEP